MTELERLERYKQDRALRLLGNPYHPEHVVPEVDDRIVFTPATPLVLTNGYPQIAIVLAVEATTPCHVWIEYDEVNWEGLPRGHGNEQLWFMMYGNGWRLLR